MPCGLDLEGELGAAQAAGPTGGKGISGPTVLGRSVASAPSKGRGSDQGFL